MNVGAVVASAKSGSAVVVALTEGGGHLLLQVLKGTVPSDDSAVDFSADDVRFKGHGTLRHATGHAYVAYMGRGSLDQLTRLLVRHDRSIRPAP